MKINKAVKFLSILLCSSLALGNVMVQPVKAITTDPQSDTTTTPTSNNDDATGVDINNTDTKSDTYTQTVNITFVDQNDNKVVDSNGTPFTLSSDYKVGTEITPSDLASTVSNKLNGGYTLDNGQSPITVTNGDNNYVLKVTAKTYTNVSLVLNDPSNNYNTAINDNSITVGQKSDSLNITENGTNKKYPLADFVFHGYGLANITFRDGTDVPNNIAEGTITITYDLIPELIDSYQSNSHAYVLKAIYSTPLDQTLTIQHVDDKGEAIPNTTDETVTGYKTADVIADPYSLAKVKDIPGYKFANTTKNYVVSDKNIIKLFYTKDDVGYLTVNYKDKTTGKTIYTDHLRGNTGDTVNIQDIATINGFDNYTMSNPNLVGNYKLTTNNENLNIDVEKKAPAHVSLVQSFANNISFTSASDFEYGDETNFDWIKLLDDNLSDVKKFTILETKGEQSDKLEFSQEQLTSMGISSLSELFASGTVIDENLSGSNTEYKVQYAPDKPINVTYQTSDNKDVEKTSLTNDSTDTVDAGTLVETSLPKGYEFVDSDYIYSINAISDDSVELVSLVKKISDSGNSGGSGNNSGNSNNKPGNVTTINESISTHPSSKDIPIYDNNGNATGKTIPTNSDFSTTQKMTLDGKTYYRITDNQWVNADDAYIYYDNPTNVKTFYDSVKKLVTSSNKAISDRMLDHDSDWYTDRYTYINNQKYYRIATNEWVSASDAFEYKLANNVVQPSSNAKLYDDRGTFVKNAPSYSLKTDKVSTINGVQMYRVATNQWLPVTDVK
ncbi:SLAP domain-containing protein [Companilactobacillus muriivasis]|uniref:SLAP domain-containing protein n=1 Tax=Companilactobacillus muriivasis TaxID=3081444 RepID=UPI0030C6BC4E